MKKRVMLLVLMAAVLFLTGCEAGYVDYDKQLNDADRKAYVLNYLEEKYSREFEVELVEQDDLEINCDEDGNCDYVTGAYEYTYECSDDAGVVFELVYTDAYVLTEEDEDVDVEAEVVCYYDDVLKFNEDNAKLIAEYDGIIRKYTTTYKRLYKAGYDHFNYYEEDYPDNFGYIYFVLYNDANAAKSMYEEINLSRRHLEQSSGSNVSVEFYFMKDWGLYNLINVSEGDIEPVSNKVTLLEKMTGLHEQVIGKDDSFSIRMYSGDTYNIEADHYYRSSFQYVVYYMNDGDFQVRGLNVSSDKVKAVVIEDYDYNDNPTVIGGEVVDVEETE